MKILIADKDRIKVIFPYNPLFVEKIKTIKSGEWQPDEKFWSFPNKNGTLEKILKIFEGEKIYIDHALNPQKEVKA